MAARAIFLDRDGTINREGGYLSETEELSLEPAAAEGLGILRQAGFLLVVVSNQSGVARGYFPEDAVRRFNEALSRALEAEGVRIDRYYFCPHYPGGVVPGYSLVCECRKPKPGLLLQAAQEADLALSRSYSVGDAARDLEAGRAAGTKTVLVLTGYGQQAANEVRQRGLADHVAEDLADAARWIVADAASGGKIVDG